MNKPKFNIGDVVFNKVHRRGSYEPSVCEPNTKLIINEISKSSNGYIYTCGYDGYEFKEEELMSKNEFVRSL